MKLSLLLAFGIFSLGAMADLPPFSLSPLHGIFLPDVLSRQTFELQPGTPVTCKNGATEGYVIYNCEVSGARFTSSGTRGKLDVVFSSFSVEKVTLDNGGFRMTYDFRGKWEDSGGTTPLKSDAELTLTSFSTAPDDWRGSFSLTDYGVSGGIQAQPDASR